MTVAILCFSSRGEAVASRLARPPEELVVRVERGGLAAAVRGLWKTSDALVFVSSLGIAVRAVAPHLSDKAGDPAVLAVTEDAALVIPVTGAHLGGGRDLAERLAGRLGVRPLLTTASDRAGFAAPDLLASRRGWKLLGRDALSGVIGRLLDAGFLRAYIDGGLSVAPLPPEYRPVASPDEADVIVSPKIVPAGGRCVQLVPRCVVAGIGCRKDVAPDALRAVFKRALESRGLLPEAVREIRSIPEKMSEPAMIALASELSVPLVPVARDVLVSLPGVFSPSAAERRFGTPGVAEPCAASAGTLLGPRIAEDGCTVAFALASALPEGRLTVLGTGPGDGEYVTLAGRRALEEADAVVGYALYADLLPPAWLEGKTVETYSMGEEEKRVERAVRLAEEGKDVVLLSGGDPVLFGLAGLARETARGRVPVRTLPGITAAQAAGALLGAPYANGLVLLSLSDYLRPWPSIRRALEGAARSGLTAALYNPVRRGLDDKLREVRDVFSSSGYTLACLVRNAGRPDASVRTIPLERLEAGLLDMRTLVLLPGEAVDREGDLFLDRRGYRTERERHADGEDPGMREHPEGNAAPEDEPRDGEARP